MDIIGEERCKLHPSMIIYHYENGDTFDTCGLCNPEQKVIHGGDRNEMLIDSEYAKLIGYLALNCEIMVSLPSPYTERFARHYNKNTGGVVDEDGNGYGLYTPKSGRVPYTYALRIQFSIPESSEITEDSFYFTKSMEEAKINDGSNKKLLSDNRWLWDMLHMGFNLGTNHNIDKIIHNIPGPFREDFLAGMDIV